MAQIRFTDPWLRADQNPGEYADAVIPFLKVRVAKSGAKTFTAVRKVAGRPVRATFGRYPAVSLAEARRRADAFAEGRDPAGTDAAKPAAVAPVVGDAVLVSTFLVDYVGDLRKRGRRYAGTVEDALITGRYALAPFLTERYGRAPLASEVTTHDLQAWMARNYERAPNFCRHLRGYTVAAWKWAVQNRFDYTGAARDYGIEHNIAAVLPTASKSRPGDRALSVEELRILWRALDRKTATHRGLLLVVAMGGLRITEILENPASCWGEDGWLRLPETKNGRAHDLPITKCASTILALSRVLQDSRSPYLLSNPEDPERPIQLTAMSRAAQRLNEALKLDPWTPRDLRRTMKTHLVERGVDERWLDIWHNHGQTADVARKHYIRAEYVELKTKVAEAIDAFLTEKVIC